jgi:hypothetical protein
MRLKIDDYRFGEHKKSLEWFRYRDSLAAQLVRSELAVEVIVGAAPLYIKNADLADYLVKNAKHKDRIGNQIHALACGISNLFMMEISRGKALGTDDGFKVWLGSWTLDKEGNAGSILTTDKLGNKLVFSPAPALADMADSGHVTEVLTGKFSASGNSSDPKQFQRSIENSFAKTPGRDAVDARLGMAYARGHTFILYKDIDGQWRPMDIYLNFDDKPEGGFKNDDYSTSKSSQRLLLDQSK